MCVTPAVRAPLFRRDRGAVDSRMPASPDPRDTEPASSTPAPPPQLARRFDEREVALIIQRAGELQQKSATAADRGGMSLVELEQIAREAGLDPALVRRAALELDDQRSAASSRLAGAPLRILLERTFQGEVSTDEFEGLVAEIRRSMSDPGVVSVLGRSVTWSPSPSGAGRRGATRRLGVTISPRNGQTTLRIEESFGQLAGGLFGGIMGGVGGGMGTSLGMSVGIGVLHSALAATGIVGGVALLAYGGARGIYTLTVNRRRRELELLRDRLAEQMERALGEQ